MRLGRYTVLRHLAKGGMADVLLGKAEGIEGFERHVVLKRIRAELAHNEHFIKMFLDEARVAASLHHQNIIQVHDIGQSDVEYFFAMEYVHGEDLRAILATQSRQRIQMPLQYVVAIVAAAAAGLHHAHERRDIVHRDVSPSNILVGYDGSVKLVDFGIAKASTGVETLAGHLKGKLAYMSPEQVSNGDVDRRSDVYSLGVVLYELATTTRLFRGETDRAVIEQIVGGRVPIPRIRRPDLSNELSMIIMTALATNPARRFASADDFRAALDHYAELAGITVQPAQLAGYMRKLFGDKREPWLEPQDAAADALEEVPTTISITGPRVTAPAMPAAARGTGSLARLGSSHELFETLSSSEAPAFTTDQHVKVRAQPLPDESPRNSRRRTAATIAVIGMLLAIIAVLSIDLLVDRAPAPNAVVLAPPRPPAPEPISAPAPVAPVPVAAPVAISVAPVRAATIASPARVPARPITPSHVAAMPTTTTIDKSVAETAATTPVAVAPAPVGAAAALAIPVPTPTTAEIATLEHATIERLASQHVGELSKCEGSDELRGEIAVQFSVDASGHVQKAQITTKLDKPKLAGCILRSIQRWQFPKQASDGAQGVYVLSFQ